MKQETKIIAIAGGTGSGKSTVSFVLLDAHPQNISLLHLDDYQKKEQEVPKLGQHFNWDHPDAINFVQLAHDLEKLKEGEAISIMTKNERDNPEYVEFSKEPGDAWGKRKPLVVEPRSVVILEGYMALVDEKVRNYFDDSIFLALDHDVRMNRRTKHIDLSYVEEVLKPMHEKYIESSKKYANHIIDVSNRTAEDTITIVQTIVDAYL